jgi:hypothetical protein
MQRTQGFPRTYVFLGVLVALACLRLCFASVLWSDEDYHMAAAIDLLHGKMPYRDFWYDKPPLAAVYYLLIDALPGVILRLWDAAYILLCCFLGYKLARSWWGESEGRWAAFLLAFFTTFYMPSAVIPFAADALLIAPHLAAIYLVRQGRPLAAGAMCGLGFWINVKGLFVLAACALWGWSALLGFSGVLMLGAVALMPGRALLAYVAQVWAWGMGYASGSPVAHPLALALERVGHWLGFHLALALGWCNAIWREERKEQVKQALWLGFSFAAVCLGNHFAPRYFLQMLPPLAVVGARGIVLALGQRRRWAIAAICLLLAVPFVRFGPRYLRMARHAPWGDIALDLDSQQVAARINALKRPGDTLFVWGYRPDIYVFTRLSPSTLVWDSQPLTGVPADRHLTAQEPSITPLTRRNWNAMLLARPAFIVDGLGQLNDKLKPEQFGEMRTLFRNYREVARTKLSVIYHRTGSPTS